MDKKNILERTLGDLIGVLTEETRRTARNKEKTCALITDSLCDLFILPPSVCKPSPRRE
jgi:hypothetical protein